MKLFVTSPEELKTKLVLDSDQNDVFLMGNEGILGLNLCETNETQWRLSILAGPRKISVRHIQYEKTFEKYLDHATRFFAYDSILNSRY